LPDRSNFSNARISFNSLFRSRENHSIADLPPSVDLP